MKTTIFLLTLFTAANAHAGATSCQKEGFTVSAGKNYYVKPGASAGKKIKLCLENQTLTTHSNNIGNNVQIVLRDEQAADGNINQHYLAVIKAVQVNDGITVLKAKLPRSLHFDPKNIDPKVSKVAVGSPIEVRSDILTYRGKIENLEPPKIVGIHSGEEPSIAIIKDAKHKGQVLLMVHSEEKLTDTFGLKKEYREAFKNTDCDRFLDHYRCKIRINPDKLPDGWQEASDFRMGVYNKKGHGTALNFDLKMIDQALNSDAPVSFDLDKQQIYHSYHADSHVHEDGEKLVSSNVFGRVGRGANVAGQAVVDGAQAAGRGIRNAGKKTAKSVTSAAGATSEKVVEATTKAKNKILGRGELGEVEGYESRISCVSGKENGKIKVYFKVPYDGHGLKINSFLETGAASTPQGKVSCKEYKKGQKIPTRTVTTPIRKDGISTTETTYHKEANQTEETHYLCSTTFDLIKDKAELEATQFKLEIEARNNQKQTVYLNKEAIAKVTNANKDRYQCNAALIEGKVCAPNKPKCFKGIKPKIPKEEGDGFQTLAQDQSQTAS